MCLFEKIKNLPAELQVIIFEYDPSFREEYNRSVEHINNYFKPKTELTFSKKYQSLFGTCNYFIYDKNYYDFCQVNMVTENYNSVNSILLHASKILLFTNIDCCDVDRHMVCRARKRDNFLENALFDYHETEEQELDLDPDDDTDLDTEDETDLDTDDDTEDETDDDTESLDTDFNEI
jgi:hypothetical protein